MTEIVDIIESLIRCIDSLSDICDEMSHDGISFSELYLKRLNIEKDELDAVKKTLVEISEEQKETEDISF